MLKRSTAAALFAAGSLSQAALAQSAIDQCAGDDPVAVKACLARVLSEREAALDAKRDELRTAARLFASAERRKTAVARVSAASTAWRALRDQDCALTASLAPEAFDPGSLQILCAIDATEVRLARLDDLIAAAAATAQIDQANLGDAGSDRPASLTPAHSSAPSSALTTTTVSAPEEGDAGGVETEAPVATRPPNVENAQRPEAGRSYFRDWLATCDDTGGCSAVSHMFAGQTAGAYGAAHVLRLSRAARTEPWALTLTTVATSADPDAPLTLAIDSAPAIAFTPRREFAPVGGADDLRVLSKEKGDEALALMKSGYRAVFSFSSRDGAAQEARFSLLGLSAALAWIDQQQGGSSPSAEAIAAPTDE